MSELPDQDMKRVLTCLGKSSRASEPKNSYSDSAMQTKRSVCAGTDPSNNKGTDALTGKLLQVPFIKSADLGQAVGIVYMLSHI